MTVTMVEDVVELDAGPISYRRYGPEDGPTVVFVHGVLVDGSLWHSVAERLGQQGYQAISPDWPLGSHRRPMNPDADLSPRGIARLVLAFLDRLGLDHVTLVGNDTGGAICQFVIDTDPGPVDRLVLTNCDAFRQFPPAFFKPMFWAGRVPALAWALFQPTRTRFTRHLLGYGPLVGGDLDPAQTKGWVTPYLHDRAVRRDVAKLMRAVKPKELDDVGSRLGRYDRPVLICWAPEDRYFRIAQAHRLVDTFPDARLVEIPDSRTFVALDQPERLATEIAGFVPAPAS